VERDRVSTAISIYSSLGIIAGIITAPLGGFLALERGYSVIFLSCIIGELINTVIASTFLRETLKPNRIKMKKTGKFKLRAFLEPEKILLPFYAISILDAVGWRISFSNLNAILVNDYGITTIQLGLMASMFSVIWGFTQAPLGVVIDNSSKQFFLILSKICYLIVSLGYLFFRSFWVFLFIQVFNGLAHSFSIPAFTAMVLSRIPEEQRGTSLGKLATYPQILGILAPYIGGLIFDKGGFQILVIIRVVFILISMAVIIIYLKEDLP
jgi:predicted MFS family arabinose efflux permease